MEFLPSFTAFLPLTFPHCNHGVLVNAFMTCGISAEVISGGEETGWELVERSRCVTAEWCLSINQQCVCLIWHVAQVDRAPRVTWGQRSMELLLQRRCERNGQVV